MATTSKAIKLVAKYNALNMAATVIEQHCHSAILEELEGIPVELLGQIDVEIKAIIKSLNSLADKAKGVHDVPDFVEDVLNLNR